MKLSGRAGALLVIVALLVLPMLPASAQSQPQPRRGGALRIAHIGEPPTLDQHATTAAITSHIMYHVNEGLFALNSKFEPKPMLVDKWSLSTDRLTYTFTLRKVKFHNGKDLTGDDVNQRNPAKARQLLAESGYKGEPVRWVTTMEYVAYGTTAQLVKPMLERVGFTVDLQVVDWATVVSRRSRPDLYDVFSTAFGFVPDPVFMLALNPTWPGWYDNRDLNAMMTLLRRHSDPKVRQDLWNRMQKLWYEEAGSIKFGDYFLLHLHRKELKGYENVPTHIWWNAWLDR